MSTHLLLNGFQEQILNFVAEQSETLVLVLTADKTVVYANRQALKMLGKDIVGRSLDQLLVEFHPAVDLSLPRQTMQMSTSFDLPQAYDVSVYPGDDLFLLCASINTTELEFLRKELIDANNQLNNLMRELHKSNAELTTLNELKNRFVGIVAHDLKSPLNGMSIICEYLDMDFDKIPKHKVSDFLSMIHSQVQFMVSLINDILDISTIESGKLKLNLVNSDVISLLLDSLTFHQLACESESIDIQTCFHDPSHEMTMDKIKIRQAFDNVVVNALKFTDAGGTVSVSTTLSDGVLGIHVSDKGPGIAEEELPHIFDPFRQAKSAAEAKAKGTGLGLTIVQKITEAHQGSVTVRNNPDAGCTFSLLLPAQGLING